MMTSMHNRKWRRISQSRSAEAMPRELGLFQTILIGKAFALLMRLQKCTPEISIDSERIFIYLAQSKK
jgi:hypothetical protein